MGEWPRERLSFPQFLHEVDEVAEIAIPLSIMGEPTSIAIRVWINNGGITVDEAGPAAGPLVSSATETSSLPTTRETATFAETEIAATASAPFPGNALEFQMSVIAALALMAVVTVAVFYWRRRRK
jgi:hypothetical protein